MCVDYGIMNGWMDGMIIPSGMAICMAGSLLQWLGWVWFMWSSDDGLLLGRHGIGYGVVYHWLLYGSVISLSISYYDWSRPYYVYAVDWFLYGCGSALVRAWLGYG